jgi:hypothetical protein
MTDLEETSGYVRQERVNKCPNSMADIWWWCSENLRAVIDVGLALIRQGLRTTFAQVLGGHPRLDGEAPHYHPLFVSTVTNYGRLLTSWYFTVTWGDHTYSTLSAKILMSLSPPATNYTLISIGLFWNRKRLDQRNDCHISNRRCVIALGTSFFPAETDV